MHLELTAQEAAKDESITPQHTLLLVEINYYQKRITSIHPAGERASGSIKNH